MQKVEMKGSFFEGRCNFEFHFLLLSYALFAFRLMAFFFYINQSKWLKILE